MHSYFDAIIERSRALGPVRAAFVHPCDRLALEGAAAVAQLGSIVPVLVANPQKLSSIALAAGIDIAAFEIVPADHSHDAAARAAQLARSGDVQMLVKGSLHSDELLHEVTRPDSGLHTQRRLSHVYAMDVAGRTEPLLISDAVVNIDPDLDDKRDIVQNAIDVARILNIAEVRVALLSAIETVNGKIPSTIDAAALCKMADRSQITGALLDGPLALDDALSSEAADEKGIVSEVAGRANVLIVPDFESGNMLAKALILLAKVSAAGVVLGARVPIVLTSRADSVATRVASAAMARLLCRRT